MIMSKNINVTNLNNASIEINDIVNKIDSLLIDYVNRISKVPTETKEWVGNASDQFAEIIKNDYKVDYLPLVESLRKVADSMHKDAIDYADIVRSTKL